MSAETVARELRVMFTANTTDLKRKIENVKSEMKKFPAATDAMQASMTKAFRVAANMTDGLERRIETMSAQMSRTGKVSESALQAMERDVADARSAYETLKGVLSGLGDQMAALGEMRLNTPEYQQLTEDIKKAELQLKRYEDQQTLMASQGISETSAQWVRLSEKIEQTKGRIKDIAFDMKQMEDAGTAFTLGADTSEFSELDQLGVRVVEQMREMQSVISFASSETTEFAHSMHEMSDAEIQALPFLERLKMAMGNLAGSLRNIATAAVYVGKKAASAIGSGLKKAVSIGVNAVKSLGQRILGLRSHTSKASGGLNNMVRSIRNIGVVSLAMRTAGALFGRFRSVINNCVQSNEAMSAQVERLKNGLSNALAPAIGAVINALSKLMPYIVGVADAVASLITNIFGKGWTAANTSASAAADAVGGVADATNAATKAQEEYNRSILGFDEINKLDASDDGSSSASGGGGGSSTTSAGGEGIKGILPQWLTDLTAEIKELLDNEDFTGIGELLAGKFGDLVLYLNKALKGEEFQRKLKDALSHITDGINGFFDKLTFDDGGKVQSIAGMFGDTVGTAIGLGLELIDQALTDIKWDKIGQSLAQFVNGGILALKKQDVNFGTVLADVINAKVSAIGGFFKEIEWSLIGSYAADNVNSAFKTVNWANVGKTFSDGVIGALKSISTFLEEVDWTGMAKDVKEAVTNVDWSGVASGIAEGIGAALGGLGAFLWELIKDGIASIGDYFDESIDEAGGNVGLGILNGIANAFSDLKQWVLDNIWEPFKTGFKRAFGIASPAKNADLLETAGYVGEGILNGIASVFTNLKSWVQDNILGKIQSAIDTGEEIVATVKGKLDNTFETVKAAFENLKDGTAWKTISGKTAAAFDTVKNVFNNLKDNTIIKTISGATSSLFNSVKNAFTGLKGDTITKTISGATAKAFTTVKNAFNAIKNSTATKTISGKVASAFNTVKSKWDSIKNKTVTITGNIIGNLKTALGLKATGGVFAGGHWSPIQAYAAGGMPGGGQLFIAREAGPELVGTLGGHTAVMNNDQIVASVSAGVARAIAGIKFYTNGGYGAYLEVIANELRSIQSVAVQYAKNQMVSSDSVNDQTAAMNHATVLGQQMINSSIVAAAQTDLLQRILAAVLDIDPAVYLDGERMKSDFVDRINRRTRANGGQCEIIF